MLSDQRGADCIGCKGRRISFRRLHFQALFWLDVGRMQHPGGNNRQIRRTDAAGRFSDARFIVQVESERPNFRAAIDIRTRACMNKGCFRLGLQLANKSGADTSTCTENAGIQT